jgi:hypothetical protein
MSQPEGVTAPTGVVRKAGGARAVAGMKPEMRQSFWT